MAAKKKPPKRKAPQKRTRRDADQGVARCMSLMADGQWVSGESHAAIAKEFGVAQATVKNWATCASRVLRQISEGDRETMRAKLFATLERVLASAMATVKPVTMRVGGTTWTEFLEAPSVQAAVSAIDVQARLLGLVTHKVDVTQRPSVAYLSRDEHLAELAKLEGEIAAEKARIAAEGTS